MKLVRKQLGQWLEQQGEALVGCSSSTFLCPLATYLHSQGDSAAHVLSTYRTTCGGNIRLPLWARTFIKCVDIRPKYIGGTASLYQMTGFEALRILRDVP